MKTKDTCYKYFQE